MAATWQSVELLSGQAVIPSVSIQTPWMDFTSAYDGYIVATAVNHISAAPTTGATVTCDISGNGETTAVGAAAIVQTGSGAGFVFSWQFDGLRGAIARVNFSGNIGSSVSSFAVGKRLTGI